MDLDSAPWNLRDDENLTMMTLTGMVSGDQRGVSGGYGMLDLQASTAACQP
ncbi:MAG: hypothetical protein R3C68_08115 [Myxococcota bacterium]